MAFDKGGPGGRTERRLEPFLRLYGPIVNVASEAFDGRTLSRSAMAGNVFLIYGLFDVK